MSMRIAEKKGTIRGEYDGSFEAYLNDEYGMDEDVELSIEDDGTMHGSMNFVFTLPNGEEITCDGYISKPPAPYYKVTIFSDTREKLGFDEDRIDG